MSQGPSALHAPRPHHRRPQRTIHTHYSPTRAIRLLVVGCWLLAAGCRAIDTAFPVQAVQVLEPSRGGCLSCIFRDTLHATRYTTWHSTALLLPASSLDPSTLLISSHYSRHKLHKLYLTTPTCTPLACDLHHRLVHVNFHSLVPPLGSFPPALIHSFPLGSRSNLLDSLTSLLSFSFHQTPTHTHDADQARRLALARRHVQLLHRDLIRQGLARGQGQVTRKRAHIGLVNCLARHLADGPLPAKAL